MTLTNEEHSKADLQVDFNARKADLEAQFEFDSARVEELERALAGLNSTLAEREQAVADARNRAEAAESRCGELEEENTGLHTQYSEREESFKKLRMAIAVANTFAGQVGDDAGENDNEANDGSEMDESK
jgi:chromosome segregation ATPase